jgi:DNA modification methylase
VIHHGDLFDVLPTIAAGTIDACVTDPPYGIGFMGREWDTFKPGTGKHRRLMHPRERALGKIESDNPNINGRWRSPALSPSQIDYDYTTAGLRRFQEWTEQWAAEVLRALKPGAYLVVCGAPRSHHRMMCGLEDAGFVVRDCFAWLFGSGFPKNFNLGDGKGTALKPGHEPIALAWKPFKGSIAANVATHGTGALNIDACRLSGTPEPDPRDRERPQLYDLGRWPANVLLDAEAAALLDEQSGELATGQWPQARGASKFQGIYQGGFSGQTELPRRNGNVGGASRFYYVAKPSREERDFGCESLPIRTADAYAEHRGRRMDEPSRIDGKPLARGRNTHPTVKPVELMRWLVRLVTPIGGTVLDPFTGSGTTGMACRYEQCAFIGIEREAEYVAIAARRIAAVAPLFSEVTA